LVLIVLPSLVLHGEANVILKYTVQSKVTMEYKRSGAEPQPLRIYSDYAPIRTYFVKLFSCVLVLIVVLIYLHVETSYF